MQFVKRNNYKIHSFGKKYPSLIFIFLIITVGFLHHRSWNKPPTSVHAWAQSDHFNLALGFLDNGFDFFHPQTYSLTHQFPPSKKLLTRKGITAVDFPLLHYCVGLAMFVLQDTSPWVFRLISLLWSLFALWFLYNTIRKIKGIRVAIFLSGFVLFQPIYCYYQNGFHVSSAAFNTLLIGICFMLKHFCTRKFKLFVFGVCLITLASLMRFTQIISLLALGGMLVIYSIRNKRLDKRLWIVVGGVACVLGYLIYNKYLAYNYGSVFLNKPLVSDSLMDLFKQLIWIGFSYLKGFLPPFHLLSVALIAVFGIEYNKKLKNYFSELFIWFVFLVTGAGIFTLLMTWSLSAHDYYSLDVWMPILVIGMILLFKNLKQEKINSPFWGKLGLLSLICMFLFAVYIQERRYGNLVEKSYTDTIISDFSESKTFLNEEISEDSKVLLICGGGWNTPMVGWRRHVSRVAWNFAKRIPDELSNDYDFIVTHNSSFQVHVLENYSEFSEKVYSQKGNGLITIWKQIK
jgi:hypothetical protein